MVKLLSQILFMFSILWILSTCGYITNRLIKCTERKQNFQFYSAQESKGLDDVTKEKIESIISKNKVVLFMKGNKLFPQWFEYLSYQKNQLIY